MTDTATEWFNTFGPTGYPGIASDPLSEGTNGWFFLHQTYDYFFNTFGRRSWDDCDMEVELYTHANFDNAFYLSCGVLAFGNGFVVDDVFAHEFMHGITHHTANLEYELEPGALNESFSDVFGAMVDTGDWLIGENMAGGPMRSLAHPPALLNHLGQPYPDHMSGFIGLPANQDPDQDNDWGGVHFNSSIPNKVAFLLGNGGIHNGLVIRRLGRAKVQRLWYDVLTTGALGPCSQFIEMRDETVTMAEEYRDQGLHGFTDIDVCDVSIAFAAVGLGVGPAHCLGIEALMDDDGDRIPNISDNCSGVPNWDQFDLDLDRIGDDCDPDDDDDGVADPWDNAPRIWNPDQADRDGDGIGDVIDDDDLDGILDVRDNCPQTANRDQLNTDGSGFGDACDSDDDDDGVPDATDNAPKVPNPDQRDTDGDGYGDVIDKCPTVFTPPFENLDIDQDGTGDVCDPDIDGDGVLNAMDNCPRTPNRDQIDLNNNGSGYACDPNKQITYPRFDARQFQLEFEFINDARVVRFPINLCTAPPCGGPLPEGSIAETRLSLPSGIRVRIVDDQGFVVAKGRGQDQLLRFPPRSDWAFEQPLGEPGGAFGLRANAGSSGPTYRGASYTLEFERDETVPSDVPLKAVLKAGTFLGTAAQLAVRYEFNRPVVTILGAPHREYCLESSSDLSVWTLVGTASAADGRIVHTGEPVVTGHRFYRAWLLP